MTSENPPPPVSGNENAGHIAVGSKTAVGATGASIGAAAEHEPVKKKVRRAKTKAKKP